MRMHGAFFVPQEPVFYNYRHIVSIRESSSQSKRYDSTRKPTRAGNKMRSSLINNYGHSTRLKPSQLLVSIGFGLLAQSSFAQGGNDQLNIVFPPELVSAIRCSSIRTVYSDLVLQGLSPRGRNSTPSYSAGQVKEIITELDDIATQLCKQIDATAGRTFTAKKQGLTDPGWQRVVADDKARQWLTVNALFLAEVDSIGTYAAFASKLHPPKTSPRPPSKERDVAQELKIVSMTDGQVMSRGMLQFFGADDHLGRVLPARFDVKRLASLEAKTRAIGVKLLAQHSVSLSDTPHMLRPDTLDPKMDKSLATAERNAQTRLQKLVEKYVVR